MKLQQTSPDLSFYCTNEKIVLEYGKSWFKSIIRKKIGYCLYKEVGTWLEVPAVWLAKLNSFLLKRLETDETWSTEVLSKPASKKISSTKEFEITPTFFQF